MSATDRLRRPTSACSGGSPQEPRLRAALVLFAVGIVLLAPAVTGRLWQRIRTTITTSPPPVHYTITDLGNAGGRFTSVHARSINDRGQVAGYGSESGRRAFLWEKGKFRVLDAPEGLTGWGMAVNNRGEVVGSFGRTDRDSQVHVVIFRNGRAVDPRILGYGYGIDDKCRVVGATRLPRHAFLYEGEKTLDLGTLGGSTSWALKINNRGQIVGTSDLASGYRHAFLYSDGKMHDLGTLGGNESLCYAINNKGWIVGFSYLANGDPRAFLYRNGRMEELEHGWDDYDIPQAINDAGTVVGVEGSKRGLLHGAIVWLSGHAYNLQDLIPPGSGWTLRMATGINDRGQITAEASHEGERGIRSCILTPVVNSRTCPAAPRWWRLF